MIVTVPSPEVAQVIIDAFQRQLLAEKGYSNRTKVRIDVQHQPDCTARIHCKASKRVEEAFHYFATGFATAARMAERAANNADALAVLDGMAKKAARRPKAASAGPKPTTGPVGGAEAPSGFRSMEEADSSEQLD